MFIDTYDIIKIVKSADVCSRFLKVFVCQMEREGFFMREKVRR